MIHEIGFPKTDDIEDLGAGVQLLHYGDGTIRVRHECGRWEDDLETDGEFIKVVAPPLHPNHVVHDRKPTTITASIACPACGLHGYATNGAWVPA